jgi:hypothetical protein
VVAKLDLQQLLRGTAPRVTPLRTAVRDPVHAHRRAGTDPIGRAARRDLPDVLHEALRPLTGAALSPTATDDHGFSLDVFSGDEADVIPWGRCPQCPSSS